MKIIPKYQKGGIPVTYYTQNEAMPLLANNPDKTAVLDEVTVKPYRKIPQQYSNGITNQAANEVADTQDKTHNLTPLFASLISAGTIPTMNEGAEDLRNGDYISGGFKLAAPIIVPGIVKFPFRFLKGMTYGKVMHNLSDYISSKFTGKTLGENISDITGLSENDAEFVHPASWWGFKQGYRASYRPNGYLGMNGIDIPDNTSKLMYYLQKGKITEKDLLKRLTQKQVRDLINMTQKGVTQENTNYYNKLLKKVVSNSKGKKNTNAEIDKALFAKKSLTPEGHLQAIRDKYSQIIKQAYDEFGIDWSDLESVMASMPDKLKLSAVGFDPKTTFLERYYKNVIEKVLGQNGIQKKLLDNKDLYRNSNGQWEGKFKDGYRKVSPTEYIKMRMANEKGYDFDLKAVKPGQTYYPMHGTRIQNYNYLTKPSSIPGQDGYFTVIQDNLGTKSNMLNFYKGRGASVPFFRIPKFEVREPTVNGIKSSNSYGGTGKSLLQIVRENPGKITKPINVSDPNGSGQRFNEYNFGPTVPNPKSMWNTLDFEPGAGPLASNITVTGNNFA